MDAAQPLLSLWGIARGPVIEASVLFNDPVFAISFSALLVIAASLYFKEGRKMPFLASAAVVALLLGFSFKAFLQEERPCAVAPSKIPCPTDFSLPSMHALLAFTVAIIALGTRSFPIYLFYALFIAFSRVYLGVHTVTEVAAGISLAFLACVLTELLFRRMKWHVPHVVHIRHDMERLPHTSGKTKIG